MLDEDRKDNLVSFENSINNNDLNNTSNNNNDNNSNNNKTDSNRTVNKPQIKGKKVMIEKTKNVNKEIKKESWFPFLGNRENKSKSNKIEGNMFPFLGGKKEKHVGLLDRVKNKQFNEKSKHKTHFISQKKMLGITAILLIVLISVFVVRPVIVGYSIIKQSADSSDQSLVDVANDMNELKLKLASAQANLTLYADIYDKVWDEVKDSSDELSKCQTEKETIYTQVGYVREEWKDDIAKCEDKQNDIIKENLVLLNDKDEEVSNAKNDLLVLEESFDNFVKNVAKSVCCKEKVDNPSINSYEVSGDKLVCLDGGENSLSC